MEGVHIEDTMLSEMCPDIESAFCFPHKYRTINGECNNVKNPTWGITGAAYLRILQPTYQDGEAGVWCSGGALMHSRSPGGAWWGDGTGVLCEGGLGGGGVISHPDHRHRRCPNP